MVSISIFIWSLNFQEKHHSFTCICLKFCHFSHKFCSIFTTQTFESYYFTLPFKKLWSLEINPGRTWIWQVLILHPRYIYYKIAFRWFDLLEWWQGWNYHFMSSCLVLPKLCGIKYHFWKISSLLWTNSFVK